MSSPVGTHSLAGLALLAALPTTRLAADAFTPTLALGQEGSWRFVQGAWHMGEGVLEQTNPLRGSAAILTEPCFGDFRLSAEFNIRPEGKGVRAAALIFRATGTMTYYWLHLDSKNKQVILVRSTPQNTWIELGRRPRDVKDDTWHTARVQCAGPRITVAVDGVELLTVEDPNLTAGRIGLGTSQGAVTFRNIQIEGEPVEMTEPLKDETPPYKVISRGGEAGPYQAFPDACRLQNGDIVVVFYDGYGHVSLPNQEFPRGGRIGMVRSSDEGRTWTAPRIIFDSPRDDRDPHIAQMSDGTLICSFFDYWPEEGVTKFRTCLTRSGDGGETWETEPQVIAESWAVSAPVREYDGVYVLGVYAEDGKQAYGGVVRSTDKGKTWSAPIPIGKEAGKYLDAETDTIRLKDGSLLAVLRSSQVNMHYATSSDLGLTWTPAQDIGFPGHAPHLTRLSTGEILLTHRVPETALHVSRDECQSWGGPYILDHVIGAYPATVELRDGTVLAIYYEEGEGSAVRALRFRLKEDGIEPLPL